jgi:hypothetical protein
MKPVSVPGSMSATLNVSRQPRSRFRYYVCPMTTPPLSSDDLRAALGANRELGADYSDAVADSFLEKVEARIEARLQELARPSRRAAPEPRTDSRHAVLTDAALGVGITGVLLSFVAFQTARHGMDVVTWELILVLSVIICSGAGIRALTSRAKLTKDAKMRQDSARPWSWMI